MKSRAKKRGSEPKKRCELEEEFERIEAIEALVEEMECKAETWREEQKRNQQ